MFLAAARALAASVRPDELEAGQLYPSIGRLRQVTLALATAIVAATGASDEPEDGIRRRVEAAMWEPEYPELVPAPHASP